MSVKIVAVLLHVMSSSVAFAVSQVQTNRIIKDNRRKASIAFIPMVLGGIVALIGTLAIMNKVNMGVKLIKNTNNLVHQIERK